MLASDQQNAIRSIKILFYISIVIVLFAISSIFVFTNTSSAEVDPFADVNELQGDVTAKKLEIEKLQERVRQLQSSIRERQSRAASLSNQLSILNSRIEQAETEIEITKNQIEQTNLEISQTQLEITQTEETIVDRKEKLSALIRRLYKMDVQSDIEILLMNDSISGFFDQFEATIQVQDSVETMIDDLKMTHQELLSKEKHLSDKKLTLVALEEKRGDDLLTFEDQSAARLQLLAQTKNSEAQFNKQLEEAKAEQIKVNADIQSLEKVIRQRLESQGPTSLNKLSGSGKMIYPVPFRGVTAYFHDPDYPYRYVFEHPAVDLRAPQGTPIKAAAAGFVARARDAGMGYSYVMLIHADGISTVYGHVSKILVKEDQFVNQGDIIALSGGQPGTPGAGNLTTGAHLHWEVRKNGIPVNPLNYVD